MVATLGYAYHTDPTPLLDAPMDLLEEMCQTIVDVSEQHKTGRRKRRR